MANVRGLTTIRLTELTHTDYARLGGMEGSEVIMWLIMRAALSGAVKKVHQTYYLPTMTGLTTAIYENLDVGVPADTHSDYRRHLQHQTAGIDQLDGTYAFTIERSVKAYRLNKFLHSLVRPEHRGKFRQDPEALFRAHQLTEHESAMVRNLEWRAMIHYGVSFFMLEKLGAVVGVPNLHIYAAMRGEPLEQFLKTRNAPTAVYSVAGKEKS
jgi:gallate dioxygenase